MKDESYYRRAGLRDQIERETRRAHGAALSVAAFVAELGCGRHEAQGALRMASALLDVHFGRLSSKSQEGVTNAESSHRSGL